jgi:hypothetical protein
VVKLRYHELCCGGSLAYHLCCKFGDGKYTYHYLKMNHYVRLTIQVMKLMLFPLLRSNFEW